MTNEVYKRIGEIIQLADKGTDETDLEIRALFVMCLPIYGNISKWLLDNRVIRYEDEWRIFLNAYGDRLMRRNDAQTGENKASVRMHPR